LVLTLGMAAIPLAQALADSTGTTSSTTVTPTPGPKVDLPPLFLANAQGEVYVVHDGNKQKADPPQEVAANDHILTGKDGQAYLEFQDGGTIGIGPVSDMKINELNIKGDNFKARFVMTFGKFKAAMHKLTAAHSLFEIEAGGVISGIRGTVFEVDYDKDKKQEATKTYEGTVYTKAQGKEQMVEKGFAMSVTDGGSPVMAALGGNDISDFLAFVDASTDLEKKKEILLKQLEKRLLERVMKQKSNSPSDIMFHF